jgi:hypothetical protein
MPVQLTTRVSLAPTALVRKLDDESVLLDLRSEQYYGLDEVGTRMLDALCTAGSAEAAASQLVGEYDVAPEVIRNDLRELADKLVERGLLLASDG